MNYHCSSKGGLIGELITAIVVVIVINDVIIVVLIIIGLAPALGTTTFGTAILVATASSSDSVKVLSH